MDKCSQCGVCCKLFWINLTEEEYRSGKYKTYFEMFGFVDNFEEAERDGANLLAKNDDDSCIYLKDNKCTIQNDKPEACRKFSCKDPQFAEMIKKIEEYKQSSVESDATKK